MNPGCPDENGSGIKTGGGGKPANRQFQEGDTLQPLEGGESGSNSFVPKGEGKKGKR